MDATNLNQFVSQYEQQIGARRAQPWTWYGQEVSIPRRVPEFGDDNASAVPDMTTADTYSTGPSVASSASTFHQPRDYRAEGRPKQPSIFSRPSISTHTAATTLPSHHQHHGHGHHHNHHPHDPPSFHQQFAQLSLASAPAPSNALWCEFRKLTGCGATFHGDNEAGWIAHHAEYHLQNRMPAECACWYCDFVPFRHRTNNDAPTAANVDDHKRNDQNDQDVRRYNFERRMEHIRDHIIHDGFTREQMRMDFFLVDHLWRNRLISSEAYRWAKSHTELPRALQFPVSSTSGQLVGAFPDPRLSRRAMTAVDLEREERKRRREGNQNRRGYTGDSDRAPIFWS